MNKAKQLAARRRRRNRYNLRRRAGGRPRLSVFRSNRHIYAQVIRDGEGHTVAAASTMEKALRDTLRSGADVEAARAVGKLVAERARAAGVTEIVFDRGAYLYHGRIRALAEAAREAGLGF